MRLCLRNFEPRHPLLRSKRIEKEEKRGFYEWMPLEKAQSLLLHLMLPFGWGEEFLVLLCQSWWGLPVTPLGNFESCFQLVSDRCPRKLKQTVVLRSVPCPEYVEGERLISSCPVGSTTRRVTSCIGLASSPKGCRRGYWGSMWQDEKDAELGSRIFIRSSKLNGSDI